MKESKVILLIFNKQIMYKPIIFKLARDFDISFNVLEAKILPRLEGRIILELEGEKNSMARSIEYLKDEGVQLEPVSERIHRDEDKCVHCGACTAVCGVDALAIDRSTMEVMFYPEKCVACGLCKKACPVNAMSGTTIDIDT